MGARLKRLWSEHEEYEKGREADFFNIEIELDDGRVYALNVWTFEYASRAKDDCEGEPKFSIGPDLLVESAERQALEAVVRTLIEYDGLQEHWRTRT